MEEIIIDIDSNKKCESDCLNICNPPKILTDIVINDDLDLLQETISTAKYSNIYSEDLLKISYINNNVEMIMFILKDICFTGKLINDYDYLLNHYNFELLKLFISESVVNGNDLVNKKLEKIVLDKRFELLYFLRNHLKKLTMYHRDKISYLEYFIAKNDNKSIKKLLDFIYKELTIKNTSIIYGVNETIYDECQLCFYKLLCEACDKNNIKLVKILLKYPVFNPSGYRLRSYKDCVYDYFIITNKKVCCYGSNRNYEVILNYPFKISCQFGYTKLVKILLENNYIDPSVDDNYGMKKALENNHTDITNLLHNFQNSDTYKKRKIILALKSENLISAWKSCCSLTFILSVLCIYLCLTFAIIIIPITLYIINKK